MTGGAVLVLGLAALAGLGAASALFGHGWVWPHGTDSIGHVIGGLLAGHPGRGLDSGQERLVATPALVYMSVAVCEIGTIVTAIVAGVFLGRYRRPGDARGGMATRDEAQQVLGIRRLREARDIIRPDLMPSTSNRRPSQ